MEPTERANARSVGAIRVALHANRNCRYPGGHRHLNPAWARRRGHIPDCTNATRIRAFRCLHRGYRLAVWKGGLKSATKLPSQLLEAEMGVEAINPVPDHLDLADAERRIKAIFIGSVGNLVEWYDFYAYTAFALYFAPAFFPNSDPVVQQLNAAVLFAATFLMRPLGGWLFGTLADRYGRRLSLTLSVVCMCFGSLMIAGTPPYASIGIAAPAILALARVIEGLSLGGEYGASATYLSEVADANHRGFYSS